MARYKRQRIEFTDLSLSTLLEETYKQACELRTTAVRLRNETDRMIKDATDKALLGKHIVDLMKAEEAAINKKLEVAKLLQIVITRNKANNGGDKDKTEVLSPERQAEIRKLIKHSQKNR